MLPAVLWSLAVIVVLPAAAASLYHFALAVVGLLPRRLALPSHADPKHNFAIVVPAHNEESSVARTVESCLALDYPRLKFTIFVVADNCTDRTAQVAEAAGAACLVRMDDTRRGKGYALGWAFEQIGHGRFDAYLVVDADCTLDSGSLRMLDQQLGAGGAYVLQMSYSWSNPDENSATYALAVANAIENRLFCAPRSRLGLPLFLRGTGMAFTTEVLERIPWCSSSITEDTEYSICLLRHRMQVRFVEEVHVRSAAPARPDQIATQRHRWAAGSAGLIRRHALSLLAEGLRKRQLRLLDAGWTLLILSRPLVILLVFAGVLISTLSFLLDPTWRSTILLATAVVALLAQAACVVSAIALLGVSRVRIGLLLGAPLTAVRVAAVTLGGLLRRETAQWVRTPRG